MPKTVKHALEIDHENGNTLWQDAIAKEMEAVWVAFKVQNDGEEPPPGHQYMDCHMVFGIKLDGFHLKPRRVARGHMTEAPTMLTYASIVSHDTVQIALLIVRELDLAMCVSPSSNGSKMRSLWTNQMKS